MLTGHPLNRDRHHGDPFLQLRERLHEVLVGVLAVEDDRVGTVDRGADVAVAKPVEHPLQKLGGGAVALVARHALEPGVEAHDQRLVEPATDVGESLVRRPDPPGEEAELVLDMDEIGPRTVHPANQIGEVAVHLSGRDPPVAVDEVLHVEGEDIGKPLEPDREPLRILGIAALLIPRGHECDGQPRGLGPGGEQIGGDRRRSAAGRRFRLNQGRIAVWHGLSLREIIHPQADADGGASGPARNRPGGLHEPGGRVATGPSPPKGSFRPGEADALRGVAALDRYERRPGGGAIRSSGTKPSCPDGIPAGGAHEGAKRRPTSDRTIQAAAATATTITIASWRSAGTGSLILRRTCRLGR